LSVSDLQGGIVVDQGGAFALVLPVASLLGAAMYGRVNVGDTFFFTMISDKGGATPSTLNTSAGWTAIGSNQTAAAAGAAATFQIRCTSIPTNASGLNAAFTIYRI
jgi:hypothetical protein